jgi:uncharacterized protein (TIGR03083 family)
LELLAADGAALADAAELDLGVPVPSCPGWHMVDLLVHVGGVHRAQTAIVAERATAAQGIRKEMFAGVPGLLDWLEKSTLFGGASDLSAVPDGVVDWFRGGCAALVAALSAADADDVVWSWSSDQTVGHYVRMMPIETAVHRWDAQRAVTDAAPIAADLAAAGIGHTFEVMVPMRRSIRPSARGDGETYCWTATDIGRRWVVRFQDGSVVVVADEEDSSGVSVSGSASDLFLFLWGRLPVTQLDVIGPMALLNRYFDLAPQL